MIIKISFYAFRAWGQETRYGRGTKTEAEEYCNILNEGRQTNLYHIIPTTQEHEEAYGIVSLKDAAVDLQEEVNAARWDSP